MAWAEASAILSREQRLLVVESYMTMKWNDLPARRVGRMIWLCSAQARYIRSHVIF